VQPRTPFFLGVWGGVRTPFGRAAIKPPTANSQENNNDKVKVVKETEKKNSNW
jgi:hypothetical protein